MHRFLRAGVSGATCVVLAGGATSVQGQEINPQQSLVGGPREMAAAVTLPDAPEISASASSSVDLAEAAASPQQNVPRHAGRYDTVILPQQVADRLSVHDKVIYGIKDSFSPFSIVGWGISAGYEQAVDGSPNYGIIGNTRTGKSFAQRLGAAAARDTSETIFSESILAPILREDPRYYMQGPSHNFFYRVAYAGTRPIFTRTDGGRKTINFSSLGGNLAGSALTQAYYPPLNRSFNQVLQTFGGSIGGSALGDLASEFLPGILTTLHFKKRD